MNYILVHSNLLKIIYIQFTPKIQFKSIQCGRSTLYCWVGEEANWCLDTRFSCLCACCCSVDSTVTVKYYIQTPSCDRIERSDFLENQIDSNRFVKWTESNRFELQIGMHCYIRSRECYNSGCTRPKSRTSTSYMRKRIVDEWNNHDQSNDSMLVD